ncbi:MAG: sigma-70 family RNA polymerase sigma factor [Candidatus Parcubacteria bacterium]|nr:sigma-70 family RNA polymerase sigma factor [Candidatus Parcubacteria bacterium]
MDLEDKQLIKNYLAGDKEALEILIDRYLKSVYNFVFRLCSNPQEASDITQETFIKAWKHLKKYNRKLNFKTWLFAIARNTTIDHLRKKKNIVFSDLENAEGDSFLDSIPSQELLPDALFEKKELNKLLNKALDQLSYNYKTVVLWHLSEGMTFEEISQILKKSVNTVKSQYRRALAILKKYLV